MSAVVVLVKSLSKKPGKGLGASEVDSRVKRSPLSLKLKNPTERFKEIRATRSSRTSSITDLMRPWPWKKKHAWTSSRLHLWQILHWSFKHWLAMGFVYKKPSWARGRFQNVTESLNYLFKFFFVCVHFMHSEIFSASGLSGLFVVLNMCVLGLCSVQELECTKRWQARCKCVAERYASCSPYHTPIWVHEGGMRERSVTEDGYEHTPSSTLWAALTTLLSLGPFDWNIL